MTDQDQTTINRGGYLLLLGITVVVALIQVYYGLNPQRNGVHRWVGDW